MIASATVERTLQVLGRAYTERDWICEDTARAVSVATTVDPAELPRVELANAFPVENEFLLTFSLHDNLHFVGETPLHHHSALVGEATGMPHPVVCKVPRLRSAEPAANGRWPASLSSTLPITVALEPTSPSFI